jgi:hypothetical protein
VSLIVYIYIFKNIEYLVKKQSKAIFSKKEEKWTSLFNFKIYCSAIIIKKNAIDTKINTKMMEQNREHKHIGTCL